MTAFKKLLVVGGLHGDEPTGIAVAKHFLSQKTKGVFGVLGNEAAIKRNKRFLETDLNRSFGKKMPVSLEEKIASSLAATVHKADLIIDIHNTKAKNCTSVIVTCKPNSLHKTLANYFGFSRMIIMPSSGSLIAQNSKRAISLEISESDRPKHSEEDLARLITNLKLVKFKRAELAYYRFVNAVPLKTLERLGIKKSQLENFVRLPKGVVAKLQLDKTKAYSPFFLKKDKKEEIAFTLIERIMEEQL